jgi:two-component system cell cycle sensor histidine kinase/response regulator CckA
MNLVVNARDAMPRGGTLTIETANVDLGADGIAGPPDATAGPHVLLAVSDTGVGMDDATRERIFEPFFTTKEPGHGTGLGLATLYGIVRQGGGSIAVESAPGHGAIFRIYLPRARTAAPAPEPKPRPAPHAPAGETVLVLEDDTSVRGVIRTVLEMAGYTVLEAGAVDAALEIVRSSEVRLLLTDIVLPGMNGPTLSRLAVDARPDLEVLYMSGYHADSTAAATLEPATAFIEKPFTADELLDAVAQALA